MTMKRFTDYYVRQKDWWRHMDNKCINYKHMSEAILETIHMSTPKQQIDRMKCFWMVK